MKNPMVSLGVPVFNGENFLEKCVRSLMAQPREDLEIILSDNASTDSTEEICRSLAAEDPRIEYFRQPENMGAAWNYNECFRRSRGELFSWTAHDDLRAPEFVEASIAALESAGLDHVLVSGKSVFIDDAGEVIGPDLDVMPARSGRAFRRLATALNNVNFAAPVFGLIRRDVLERTRLIGPFAASDYVLICELAMLGKVAEIDDLLFFRRLHPESSREANSSRESVQEWFDPSAPPKASSDRSKLFIEYQRSVANIDLGPIETIMCRATIPAVMSARRSRVLIGRWRRRMVGKEVVPHASDIMSEQAEQDNGTAEGP